MTDDLNDAASKPATKDASPVMDGAFGAGLVLIVLPSVALVIFTNRLALEPSVGLPILAIFGIMILFGALALISTLFARLNLSSKNEALALPPGSIRAAITLALIVLFALISVMLYQSLEKTYAIEGLSEAEKAALVKDPTNRVTAVIPGVCPELKAVSSGAETKAVRCTPGDPLYTVHLRQAPGAESTDLAKQLLIMIGTLMTSATSFYFASRASESATKTAVATFQAATAPRVQPDDPLPSDDKDPQQPAADPADADEGHMDCCNLPIDNATADADLPPSRGGVAS